MEIKGKKLDQLQSLQNNKKKSKQKLKIIYLNAQYIRDKTKLFTAFLQTAIPRYHCYV
jgi:hypothetical protein